ncbi:MAG: membrane protein insertase YidC, partial [Thermomonas sp.]
MSQTRTFLIFAWMIVAALLWVEWTKEQQPQLPATTPVVAAASIAADAPVSSAGVPFASVPGSTTAAPVPAIGSAPSVTLRNDVLALQLDGRSITDAKLLKYTQSRDHGSAAVVLFDPAPATYFAARSGWLGADGVDVTFMSETTAREAVLADQAKDVTTSFIARDANGVQVRRTYTLTRGSYAVRVHDEVTNAGNAAWTGSVYRQLMRNPPAAKGMGMTNPESFSLNGAAWYSPEDKYKKRKYPQFVDDGPLDQQVTGGWVALSQHYFLTAWIPQKDQAALFSLGVAGTTHRIVAAGP